MIGKPLSKKETKELRTKIKKIKKIIFHKEFDKGMRLALCVKCGYPVVFYGVMIYKGDCMLKECSCKKSKYKEYKFDKFEDFILKIQNVLEEKSRI